MKFLSALLLIAVSGFVPAANASVFFGKTSVHPKTHKVKKHKTPKH